MMKASIKISLFVITSIYLSYSAHASTTDTSNFDCTFDKHYATYLNQDKTERYQKDPTHLSFIGNKTTGTTKNIDGAKRSTNSNKWNLISSDGLGARYIGSDGDLLTIIYRPGDGRGEYTAALQWTALGYAFTSVGLCTGEP